MNKRIPITFSDEQVEVIKKISKREDRPFADTVRSLCDEAIKLQVSKENIDLVVDIIDERIRSVLSPSVERLASISVKGAIMSATSVFLNAQALVDFVPPDKRKDFKEMYDNSRRKGIAYIKSHAYDIEDIKKNIDNG